MRRPHRERLVRALWGLIGDGHELAHEAEFVPARAVCGLRNALRPHPEQAAKEPNEPPRSYRGFVPQREVEVG